MKEFSFVAPMTPIAKGRPQKSSTGHFFTPTKTREAEKVFAHYLYEEMQAQGFEINGNPCMIEIEFCFPLLEKKLKELPEEEAKKLDAVGHCENWWKFAGEAVNRRARQLLGLCPAVNNLVKAIILHYSKPDLDNLVKLTLDSCNKILYFDDSQCFKLTVSKYRTEKPCIIFKAVFLA